jgi:hypothetical protein
MRRQKIDMDDDKESALCLLELVQRSLERKIECRNAARDRRECAPHRVYYRDIDSVFTSAELPTGTGLGEMKLEFLAPKSYRLSAARGKSR